MRQDEWQLTENGRIDQSIYLFIALTGSALKCVVLLEQCDVLFLAKLPTF